MFLLSSLYGRTLSSFSLPRLFMTASTKKNTAVGGGEEEEMEEEEEAQGLPLRLYSRKLRLNGEGQILIYYEPPGKGRGGEEKKLG